MFALVSKLYTVRTCSHVHQFQVASSVQQWPGFGLDWSACEVAQATRHTANMFRTNPNTLCTLELSCYKMPLLGLLCGSYALTTYYSCSVIRSHCCVAGWLHAAALSQEPPGGGAAAGGGGSPGGMHTLGESSSEVPAESHCERRVGAGKALYLPALPTLYDSCIW